MVCIDNRISCRNLLTSTQARLDDFESNAHIFDRPVRGILEECTQRSSARRYASSIRTNRVWSDCKASCRNGSYGVGDSSGGADYLNFSSLCHTRTRAFHGVNTTSSWSSCNDSTRSSCGIGIHRAFEAKTSTQSHGYTSDSNAIDVNNFDRQSDLSAWGGCSRNRGQTDFASGNGNFVCLGFVTHRHRQVNGSIRFISPGRNFPYHLTRGVSHSGYGSINTGIRAHLECHPRNRVIGGIQCGRSQGSFVSARV